MPLRESPSQMEWKRSVNLLIEHARVARRDDIPPEKPYLPFSSSSGFVFFCDGFADIYYARRKVCFSPRWDVHRLYKEWATFCATSPWNVFFAHPQSISIRWRSATRDARWYTWSKLQAWWDGTRHDRHYNFPVWRRHTNLCISLFFARQKLFCGEGGWRRSISFRTSSGSYQEYTMRYSCISSWISRISFRGSVDRRWQSVKQVIVTPHTSHRQRQAWHWGGPTGLGPTGSGCFCWTLVVEEGCTVWWVSENHHPHKYRCWASLLSDLIIIIYVSERFRCHICLFWALSSGQTIKSLVLSDPLSCFDDEFEKRTGGLIMEGSHKNLRGTSFSIKVDWYSRRIDDEKRGFVVS